MVVDVHKEEDVALPRLYTSATRARPGLLPALPLASTFAVPYNAMRRDDTPLLLEENPLHHPHHLHNHHLTRYMKAKSGRTSEVLALFKY